jgi:rare lipoprotein A
VGLGLALLAGCAHQVRPSDREWSGPQEGVASFYGRGFANRPTANGERFDPTQMTAAHRTLPFNTCVQVKNLENGSTVRVRINDRGPYAHQRLIDLSEAAARKLGMLQEGVAHVRLTPCH